MNGGQLEMDFSRNRMPAGKFTERVVANPFKNKNVGRRTGKDIKAGKVIRKMPGGFENFDDYWSESDADMTKDGTFVKPNTSATVMVVEVSDAADEPPPPLAPDPMPVRTTASLQSVLVQSQTGNAGPVKNALNPFLNKQIGRRTGKDIKAGKKIRMLEGGFENFDDYWSESEADSIASFSISSTSIKKAATSRRSSGRVSQADRRSSRGKAPTAQEGVPGHRREATSTEEEPPSSQDTGGATDSDIETESQDEAQNRDSRDSPGNADGHGDRGSQEDRYNQVGRDGEDGRNSPGERNNQGGRDSQDSREGRDSQESECSQEDTNPQRSGSSQEDTLQGQEGLDSGACKENGRKTGSDQDARESQEGQGISDDAVSEMDGAVSEVDGAVSKIDAATSEIDGAVSEVDGAVSEVDGAVSEVDAAVSEADAAVSETDGAVSEVDGAVSKVDGAGSKVDGAGSEVDGAGSKVDGAGSKADVEVCREGGAKGEQPGAESRRLEKANSLGTEEGAGVQRQDEEAAERSGPEGDGVPTGEEAESTSEEKEEDGQQESDGGKQLNPQGSQKAAATAMLQTTSTHGAASLSQTAAATAMLQTTSTHGAASLSQTAAATARQQTTSTHGAASLSQTAAATARLQTTSICSAVSLSQTAAANSTANAAQVPSQGSLSQMNATASPLATSQKSSVYLAIAGDVTGSITRLNSDSVPSPGLRLFGTRKRLSYADSPGERQCPVTTTDKQRSGLARPAPKNSRLKAATCPRPPDLQAESGQDTGEPHLRSASQRGQKRGLKKQPQSSQLQAGDVSAESQQQSLWVESVKSRSGSSRAGMFVSLVSQARSKADAGSLFGSASNSDDEFEILDVSRVYGGRTVKVRGGAKATAALRKQPGSVSADAVPNVMGKGKHTARPVTSKSPLSSNDADEDISPADSKNQHKTTKGTDKARKSTKQKPGKLDDEGGPVSSADTETQQKTTKESSTARRNTEKKPVTSKVENRQACPTDAEKSAQETDRRGKISQAKPSISGNEDAHVSLTDPETHYKKISSKDSSRKVSAKQPVVFSSDGELSPAVLESPGEEVKETDSKGKPSRKRASAASKDSRQIPSTNSQPQEKKTGTKDKTRKVAAEKPAISATDDGEMSPTVSRPQRKKTEIKDKTRKVAAEKPVTSTADDGEMSPAISIPQEKKTGTKDKTRKVAAEKPAVSTTDDDEMSPTVSRPQRKKTGTKDKTRKVAAEKPVTSTTDDSETSPTDLEIQEKETKDSEAATSARDVQETVEDGAAPSKAQAPHRATRKARGTGRRNKLGEQEKGTGDIVSARGMGSQNKPGEQEKGAGEIVSEVASQEKLGTGRRTRKPRKSRTEAQSTEAEEAMGAKPTKPATRIRSTRQQQKSVTTAGETEPQRKTVKNDDASAASRTSAGFKRKSLSDICEVESAGDAVSSDSAKDVAGRPSPPKKAGKVSSRTGARLSVQSSEQSSQQAVTEAVDKSRRQSGKRRLFGVNRASDTFLEAPVTLTVQAQVHAVEADVHAVDVYELSPNSGSSVSPNEKQPAGGKKKSGRRRSQASTKRKTTKGKKARGTPEADVPLRVDAANSEGEQVVCTPAGGSESIADLQGSALKSGISFRRFSRIPSSLKAKRSRQLMNTSSEDIRDDVISTPPLGGSPAIVDLQDSALKSGISFRHFSRIPSSLKTKRSRQLMNTSSEDIHDDIISTPPLEKRSRPAEGASPLPPASAPAQGRKSGANRKRERRVTICDDVTHHSFSPHEDADDNTTALPSMSATPVHYHQVASPASPLRCQWDVNKIVYPQNNTVGLRRSQRTRVRPLEWYKNERIIYDRRKSGPVVLAVQPSRERIYQEQENLQRRKRRQKLLMKKKQQQTRRRRSRRLSRHVPVSSNLHITFSTEIPILDPVTKEEMLMGCLNPASAAVTVGANGNAASADDPFTLKLMTQQKLFTTGILTLASAGEKPLQRATSTAVLFSITQGNVLVTINRATTILETDDHFFIPKGVVYSLKNLRLEEAVLSFVNLTLDTAEEPATPQQHNQQSTSSQH